MPFDPKVVRKLREKQGMSQIEAGAKAGFKGRGEWERYEAARRTPTIAKLEAMARALGVAPGKLLGENEGSPRRVAAEASGSTSET